MIRKTINILGFGCGDEGEITLRTLSVLQSSGKVFARTLTHPAASVLEKHSVTCTSFDSLYENADSFEELYQKIADEILGCSESQIAYIVPGSAVFAERSVQILLQAEDENTKINIIPSVSFIDGVLASLKFDGADSFKLIDALSAGQQKPDVSAANIICQIYDAQTASDLKLELMKYYADEMPVIMVFSAGCPDERILSVPLHEIDMAEGIDHLTTLFIPPADFYSAPSSFDSLKEVFMHLRGENGCPWDKEQTHESLSRYLLEESYEVIDAINKKDPDLLLEELGDLLLQIMLHCQIASENRQFDVYDVISFLNRKMIRRHPHVFADEEHTDLEKMWEEIKTKEHNYTTVSEKMEDTAKSFPAAVYAQKIQSLAAKAGFDFSEAEQIFEKVAEETDELREEAKRGDLIKTAEECGDLLFSAVNAARFLSLDAETVLRDATTKFMDRFRRMESALKKDNKDFLTVSEEKLEMYWKVSK